MFILRRITSENRESNTSLGDEYAIIRTENDEKDFNFFIDKYKCDKKDVYAFISCKNGSKTVPLYKKSVYFIMTGSGQTFANISYGKF